MSGGGNEGVASTVVAGLRSVVRGTDDPRIRATWRVLLAAFVVQALAETVAVLLVGGLGLRGRIFVGVSQAAAFGLVLLAWARYIGERSLADYGVAATPSWVLDLGAGFVALLAVWGLWFGLGSAMGWTGVAVSASAPGGGLVLGLVVAFVALGLNVWVQDTLFWALVARNAAEGFHSRGLTPVHAVVGGWLVGVLYFTLIHGPSGLGAVLNLVFGGAVFGLLYLHTGKLALTMGAHLGNNLVSNHVFVRPDLAGEVPSLLVVTGGYPGPAMLNQVAFPRTVAAYVLLVGYLWVRYGEVGIDTDIARWSDG